MHGGRGHQHSEGVRPGGVSRRSFLRRAGVTGAAAAAMIGIADVAGMSSAFAATRKRPASCGCFETCRYTPRQCNGGKACPSGKCCFTCSFGGSAAGCDTRGGLVACMAGPCVDKAPVCV
jgi:hypothetical protein